MPTNLSREQPEENPARGFEDNAGRGSEEYAAEDGAHRLVRLFAAFGPAYMKWLSAEARVSGTTYARMRLLHVLSCGDARMMSSLGEELGVTPRSVTSLVDALEGDGLLSRRAHPTDRRATLVGLTEAGKAVVADQFESHTRRAARLFGSLEQEEQQELLRVMGHLLERLEHETAGDAGGAE